MHLQAKGGVTHTHVSLYYLQSTAHVTGGTDADVLYFSEVELSRNSHSFLYLNTVSATKNRIKQRYSPI